MSAVQIILTVMFAANVAAIPVIATQLGKPRPPWNLTHLLVTMGQTALYAVMAFGVIR